jgi:broad specificity phosphatase PhoE
MTRSIQTAALIFGDALMRGDAQLIIRPEIREYWPDNIENRGRSLPSLRSCPELAELPCWEMVEQALSEESTADWADEWDDGQAEGEDGAWQKHCVSGERLEKFRQWFAQQDQQRVAIVSHWGAINNLLNREPWADARNKFGLDSVSVLLLPMA